jgi:hypothetical protein
MECQGGGRDLYEERASSGLHPAKMSNVDAWAQLYYQKIREIALVCFDGLQDAAKIPSSLPFKGLAVNTSMIVKLNEKKQQVYSMYQNCIRPKRKHKAKMPHNLVLKLITA